MIRSFFRSLFLIALCFSVVSASAQTVTEPAYANMQRAIGGILSDTMASRGYVSSDPRTYATLKAIGTSASAGVATAGAGLLIAGTTPAWGTVLAVAAVSGAVSYAVSLGLDAAVKWAFGSGSSPITSTTKTQSTGAPVAVRFIEPGQSLTADQMTAMQTATQIFEHSSISNPWYTYWIQSTKTYTNPDPTLFKSGLFMNWNTSGTNYFLWKSPVVQLSVTPDCPVNTTRNGSQCVGSVGTTDVVKTSQTLDQAANALSMDNKNQKLSYEVLALMVNDLWKKSAAEPGYSGVPYSVTNPVTAADVQKWADANPSSYPTVGALTSPVTDPAGFSPSSTVDPTKPVTPSTSTTSSTSTNSSTSSPINLGPDPNILPRTPDTPSASSIFEPILSIARPFINFQISAPAGVCPKPQFSVFGTVLGMTQHCDILESLRSTIQAVMSAVFIIAAILIIFSA